MCISDKIENRILITNLLNNLFYKINNIVHTNVY